MRCLISWWNGYYFGKFENLYYKDDTIQSFYNPFDVRIKW